MATEVIHTRHGARVVRVTRTIEVVRTVEVSAELVEAGASAVLAEVRDRVECGNIPAPDIGPMRGWEVVGETTGYDIA